MERLQKYIASCGICSRRKAEKLIEAGEISVNGQIVRQLGTTVTAGDCVMYKGKVITPETEKVYYLLNKPKGYLSSVRDDRGRKTVLDLLPPQKERIYPVGRLDNNTEGLLLLTNDGALMNFLLHPKFVINKTYVAKVRGALAAEKIKKLRSGILLEDGLTAPAEVRIISYDAEMDLSKIEMTIHEGRNRQIRRMLAAVKSDVISLKRIKFAGLNLHGIKRGMYRALSKEEIDKLYYLGKGAKA